MSDLTKAIGALVQLVVMFVLLGLIAHFNLPRMAIDRQLRERGEPPLDFRLCAFWRVSASEQCRWLTSPSLIKFVVLVTLTLRASAEAWSLECEKWRTTPPQGGRGGGAFQSLRPRWSLLVAKISVWSVSACASTRS